MKKSLLLTIICILFLTGCGETEKIIEKEKHDANKPIQKVEDIVEKNVEIKKEDKEVNKLLKDLGYDVEYGYTLYPTNEYFYPEYLSIDGTLKRVYIDCSKIEIKKAMDLNEDGLVFNGIVNYGGVAEEGMVMDMVASSPSLSMPSLPNFFEGEILNTSEYKEVNEKGFSNVKTSPLSTFSADVDTASYTNFRAILRDHLLYNNLNKEDLHDVRIEEMLNYFTYPSYEKSDENFTISAEISKTPWNEDTNLLVVNVKAKELNLEDNKGSNLVFLVDTSGSMDDSQKLPLLKESLKLLVNELSEKDRVSIVTYSGNETVIIDGTSGNNKEEIINAIDELIPYGSTNGEGGIKKAYEIASKYKDEHDNSRIIMCTDGDLNVGISSESELIKLVEKKRETGVYLSVLGFGLGNYKDNKLEALANNGNGNYFYIDNIAEGKKVLVDDMLSNLITLGDDVKFQIEFNPNFIKGYRKIGYENRDLQNEDFENDAKDAGEVGYGHEVTIVYEIVLSNSNLDVGESNLKYQEVTTNEEIKDWLTISVRYKNHGEKESNLIEFVVDDQNYTEEPSNDWKFISNVVGFGLILNDSEYKEDLMVNDIVSSLEVLNLEDDLKAEFLALVYSYKNSIEDFKN